MSNTTTPDLRIGLVDKSRHSLRILVISSLWVIAFLTGCVTIKSVDQPTYAQAGHIFTTTVAAYPSDYPGDGRPYFGLHLPEGWLVMEPITYSGSYTGSLTYDSDLSAQMESTLPETGYYWWVGEGNQHEVLSSGQTATGTLRIQTGHQAGFYYLDYMTGDSEDGLNSDLKENIPITVTAAYGAGWRPIPSRQYVASQVITINIPATLVSLGQSGLDSFDLSAIPPAGWQADFYGPMPITNTGPMTFLQTLPLTLQVMAPPDVSPGSKLISISATSTSDANATASALIDLTLLSDQRGYALTSNNAVRVIDPMTHQRVEISSSPMPYAESLAIHPDGEYIYATFPDNVLVLPGYHILEIINTTTGVHYVCLLPEGARLGIVTFTCDGSKVLVTDRAANRLFFLRTAVPRFPFPAGTITALPGIVNHVAIGGCGTNLALTTHKNNGSVAIIDTDLMTVVKTIPGFNNPGDVVVTSDGQRAYVANADGTIGVIDLVNQTLVENLDVGNTTANQLAISPDGQFLYIGAATRLLVWGSPTSDIYFPGNIQDIEISPDGRALFVAHNQSTLSPTNSAISIVQTSSNQVMDVIKFEDTLRKLTLFSPACNCQLTYLPIVLKK